MRPKKDNIDYFSHDNDMRNDSKIKSVIHKFWLPWYAIRCMLLECLCRSSCLFLSISDAEIDLLSADMYSDTDIVLPIIEFCVKVWLIQRDWDKIRCKKLNERLSPILQKRKYNEEYYNEQKESNKEKESNNNNNNNRKLADKFLKESETIVSATETNFIPTEKRNNLKQIITSSLGEIPSEYHSILEEFIDYWSEPDKKGNEKWTTQKTWDLKLRLKKWKKNADTNFGRKQIIDYWTIDTFHQGIVNDKLDDIKNFFRNKYWTDWKDKYLEIKHQRKASPLYLTL